MTVTTEVPERRATGPGRDTGSEVPMLDHPTCGCGCGQEIDPFRPGKPPRRFIHGHHSRLLRKQVVITLSEPRRVALYEAAGNCCEQCGRSMDEQVAMFGRRLEIHHKNHNHEDNSEGNHEVLCTGCHNHESLVVRDEVRKGATFTTRRQSGLVRNKADGQTHCKRGHEFTPENTYLWQGHRVCRACSRMRTLSYKRAAR